MESLLNEVCYIWQDGDLIIAEALIYFNLLVITHPQTFSVTQEKDEPEGKANVKADIGMIFDGITYFERDQAQRHLELLQDAIAVKGYVSVRDYYRLAEFLQIIPKWTAMYFRDEYGWRDLSLARINTTHSRGMDLWTLEMPVPEKLSRD